LKNTNTLITFFRLDRSYLLEPNVLFLLMIKLGKNLLT